MKVQPLNQDTLVAEITKRIGTQTKRVIIDGARAARPHELADKIAKTLSRPTLRVSTWDFLRPASLRLEHGRTDPYSFRHDWLDEKALRREVLEAGDKILPTLWNAETDRATRAEYVPLPANGVLLIDGTLLLDRNLPADLTVHLYLSPAALGRKTEPEWQWTLPAYDDYEPHADVTIRYDHPDRPGLVLSNT